MTKRFTVISVVALCLAVLATFWWQGSKTMPETPVVISPASPPQISLKPGNKVVLKKVEALTSGNSTKQASVTVQGGALEPSSRTGVYQAPTEWPEVVWVEKGVPKPLAWNQLAETPRIYVQTGQWVEVRLRFPLGQPGEKIRVEMLDGGILGNDKPGELLSLGSDLSVVSKAQISGNEGIHRVRLTRGVESFTLNFWAGEENVYAQAEPEKVSGGGNR